MAVAMLRLVLRLVLLLWVLHRCQHLGCSICKDMDHHLAIQDKKFQDSQVLFQWVLNLDIIQVDGVNHLSMKMENHYMVMMYLIKMVK